MMALTPAGQEPFVQRFGQELLQIVRDAQYEMADNELRQRILVRLHAYVAQGVARREFRQFAHHWEVNFPQSNDGAISLQINCYGADGELISDYNCFDADPTEQRYLRTL